MWFAAKGAKGGLNPVFFIFDPKTQKPNSAARPPLKSRRWSAESANQLVAGWLNAVLEKAGRTRGNPDEN